jgi:SAM-dependent methyltransferase
MFASAQERSGARSYAGFLDMKDRTPDSGNNMRINRTRGLPARDRRRFLELGFAAMSAGLVPWAASAQNPPRRLDVPFEPSPPDVIDKMLEMAKVSSADLLYDLGCGDGRIVVAAAVKYRAHGVGIDIDPQRIEEANDNAHRAEVEELVRFRVGDLYTADFSDATVVTLFLWPQVNRKLRPILWRQLKPGTRIVSYIWNMGDDWPPQRTETVRDRKIYLWTVTDAQKKQV